jgi:hypothetical protein
MRTSGSIRRRRLRLGSSRGSIEGDRLTPFAKIASVHCQRASPQTVPAIILEMPWIEWRGGVQTIGGRFADLNIGKFLKDFHFGFFFLTSLPNKASISSSKSVHGLC